MNERAEGEQNGMEQFADLIRDGQQVVVAANVALKDDDITDINGVPAVVCAQGTRDDFAKQYEKYDWLPEGLKDYKHFYFVMDPEKFAAAREEYRQAEIDYGWRMIQQAFRGPHNWE